MKKKMIFALLLAGMSLVVNTADAKKKAIDISNNHDKDDRIWVDLYDAQGNNYYGCVDTGGNCTATVVVTGSN